jgi:hypothetical protein
MPPRRRYIKHKIINNNVYLLDENNVGLTHFNSAIELTRFVAGLIHTGMEAFGDEEMNDKISMLFEKEDE